MKITATDISETHVHIRIADDAAGPTAWVDIQVPLKGLKGHPNSPDELGDIESHYVAEVRQAALRAAREIIGVEIQRLADLAGRISG